MAFTRKKKNKLQLDEAHSMDDIRGLLLDAYGRLNTLQAVAKEFGTSPSTMSVWYREMGLHTSTAKPSRVNSKKRQPGGRTK